MEKEYCADCYCRMLAHDGFEGGVKDADGQPKLMTWGIVTIKIGRCQ